MLANEKFSGLFFFLIIEKEKKRLTSQILKDIVQFN
jgi:hypothetical protein